MCVLSHTVVAMAVHEPNEETIFWVKGNEERKLDQVQNSNKPTSQLTAFFDLCSKDPEARELTYPEVCKHYRSVFLRLNRHCS